MAAHIQRDDMEALAEISREAVKPSSTSSLIRAEFSASMYPI
jgi:hypothetical protein